MISASEHDKQIFYNLILVTEDFSDESDVFVLRHNGIDEVIVPRMIFSESKIYNLPMTVLIEKNDLFISSHDCVLTHLNVGLAVTYLRKIMTLQKYKETKFNVAEGSNILLPKGKSSW